MTNGKRDTVTKACLDVLPLEEFHVYTGASVLAGAAWHGMMAVR
jgi:hypothetical protein